MQHCNPCKTPIDTESKLGPDGDPVSDSTLYRSLADPREPHLAPLKRILRHVRGCPVTRRSTSGYYVFLKDNLLSWSAKRQVTLSRSSAEAEYRGVANVVAETAWIHNFLLELHAPLHTAVLVYCDKYKT
ncbi:ribonuclease H-like domain-containing protein [Tanacetum coccineum]